MTAAVTISGLTVRRGGRALLDGVDLEVPEGGFVAVLGPNGTGKTTLLKAVLGLAHPYEGAIALGGAPADRMSPRERAQRVAWLPQRDTTAESVPVLDFIVTARYRFSESREVSCRVARQTLARLDVAHLEDRGLATLSGGELQRVAFACLEAQESPTLLVDEPGNHLDPGHQIQMMERLGALWTGGRTVVCVTHNVNLLRNVAPADAHGQVSVVGLREGAVAFQAPLTDPEMAHHLSELFGVRFSSVPMAGGPYFAITPEGAP